MKDSPASGIGSSCLLIEGDGARMDMLRDGEADLILTSPPYFDEIHTAPLLMAPIHRQDQFERLQQCLDTFAAGLRPVFCEMNRTLRSGGALIIQTKDIRYGGFLLPLAQTHRRILAEIGFGLVTRISWRKFSWRRKASAVFLKTRAIGSFRADDTEDFLVFGRRDGIRVGEETVDISLEDAAVWTAPLWETPGAGGSASHPHQAPPEPVRRLIQLFSLPGQLVADPFAGHGTTLLEAARLKRRAIGYEIDPERAQYARAKLARLLANKENKESK